MREERGQVSGDFVVYEPFTLWGSIGGNVKVIENGKLYVRGTIYGNLIAEPGARVHVFGNISGDITVEEKAKVIVSGVVGGDAVNNGGRLYIENMAKIMGKVKTKKGETKIQAAERPPKDE